MLTFLHDLQADYCSVRDQCSCTVVLVQTVPTKETLKVSACPKMKNMTNWVHRKVSFGYPTHFTGKSISLLTYVSIRRVSKCLSLNVRVKIVKILTEKKTKNTEI